MKWAGFGPTCLCDGDAEVSLARLEAAFFNFRYLWKNILKGAGIEWSGWFRRAGWKSRYRWSVLEEGGSATRVGHGTIFPTAQVNQIEDVP